MKIKFLGRLLFGLGILGALAIIVAVVAIVPTWLAANAFAGGHVVPKDDEWAIRVSDERRAVLWMLGGLIALGGLFYTHQRHRLNEIQHELTRDENRTTRYTASVTQIGDKSIDVRLGGIYALERLARDSTSDRETVWEVLSAFIREHTQSRKSGAPISTDVAAALAVVIRNKPEHLDLRGADLRGADLVGADFRGALLDRANLDGTNLTATLLSDVLARGASFVGTRLIEVQMEGADFTGADFTDANMFRAVVDDAKLIAANLTRANLSRASLRNVSMWRSNVEGARVKYADFAGADLTDVRIYDAIGVELATNLDKAENVVSRKVNKA